ncbi:MAG: TPM domain-containing protein [Patescibacteria group bacterium]
MKALATASILGAALLSLAPIAFAYTSPGSPSGYVNDFARVLSTEAIQTLNAELTAFEQSTSNEITVVTVPNMGGDYIENYAVKLFEEWGVGKEDRDNGILLLLSIEERAMRIEVGYGLEGALPDSLAQRILDNEMTPKLKAGDYDGAVTAAATALEQATKGEYTGKSSASDFFTNLSLETVFVFLFLIPQFLAAILARSKSWWAGGVVGGAGGLGIGWLLALSLVSLFGLTVVLVFLGMLFDYFVSKGYKDAKARGMNPPWWTGGSLGRSGGGGFGGFGGGSSGGGGASGRW